MMLPEQTPSGTYRRGLPGALGVVVVPPLFNLISVMIKKEDAVLVQSVRPHPCVERFNHRVVGGLSRTGEVQFHTVEIGRLVQHLGGEFAPVISREGLAQPATERQIR
jgi:hypothetical protein